MKLITVEDILKCHNNVCGFSHCPVIVQLDNDPPHERELSLYFFSLLEGGAKSGMYDYLVRDAAHKQELDFSRMTVVGFRPVMVKDTGFFAELGIDVSSGFIMLVKAHPIEVFEGEENDRK